MLKRQLNYDCQNVSTPYHKASHYTYMYIAVIGTHRTKWIFIWGGGGGPGAGGGSGMGMPPRMKPKYIQLLEINNYSSVTILNHMKLHTYSVEKFEFWGGRIQRVTPPPHTHTLCKSLV